MNEHLFFGRQRAIGSKQQFGYEVAQEEYDRVKDEAQDDEPQLNVPRCVVHGEVFFPT